MDSFTDEGALFDLSAVVREAIRALDDHRPADAAQLLRDHLWRDPQNAVAYGVLGAALLQTGEVDAAMEALDRAHYLQPANAQILYYYGLASQSAGLNGDASRRFEAALKLDPYHLPTRRRLAVLGYEISREAADAASEAALDGIAELAPDLVDREPPRSGSAVRVEPSDRDGAAPAIVGDTLLEPQQVETPAAAVSGPPETRRDSDVNVVPAGAPPSVDRIFRPPQLADEAPGAQLPGVSGLLRATVEMWLQHLLLWFLILALPNGLAAISFVLIYRDPGALAPLVWAGALAVGAGPVVLAMAGQFIHGRPFPPEWRLSPVRMGRALAILAPYALLILGPLAAGFSFWMPVPHEYLLLIALGLAVPLHLYVAPAILLAVTDGPGGIAALRIAARLSGKRSWLHLAVVLVMTFAAGTVVAALEWTTSTTLAGMGDGVLRLLRATWLTVGESLWAAAFTLSGVDAVSSDAPVDEDDE